MLTTNSKFAIEGFIEALSKELDPKWNIRILIAEPGAIKGTAFNTSILSKRDIHPAYQDPDCPTNIVRKWLAQPDLEDDFSPASDMAATLVNALIGGGLPLRVPLGSDSWEGIRKDIDAKAKELDDWQAVSKLRMVF